MTKFLSNRPVKSTLTAGQSMVKPALKILMYPVVSQLASQANAHRTVKKLVTTSFWNVCRAVWHKIFSGTTCCLIIM